MSQLYELAQLQMIALDAFRAVGNGNGKEGHSFFLPNELAEKCTELWVKIDREIDRLSSAIEMEMINNMEMRVFQQSIICEIIKVITPHCNADVQTSLYSAFWVVLERQTTEISGSFASSGRRRWGKKSRSNRAIE